LTARGRPSDELLREIAYGDLSGVGPLVNDPTRARKAAGLDQDSFQLAEIAALAAVDAPPESWSLHLTGQRTRIDVDRVLGTLIAITPIVGTPRVVSAAANILAATDLVEQLDDESI